MTIWALNTHSHMISNTLKFKTGNRVSSNPVLSELIRSFELQRPIQRSLTPKWDLSWVLSCLQKAPYKPLRKASKLHVAIKTAFLLALAIAKGCSEIHALAMDANHLRFNQSNGSVSLSKLVSWQKISFHLSAQILLLFLIWLVHTKGNNRIDFYA